MAKRSLKDMKEELQKVKHIIPWEEITVDTVYHVPPIITLERRDIIILTKDNEKATYRRVDDTEKKEGSMHKTSIFARFLVKRRKF